jgi:hypothetical protein
MRGYRHLAMGCRKFRDAERRALDSGIFVQIPPPPLSYETLDQIAAALKKQGLFNAGAAVCAAIAAVIQAVLITAQTCIHLS